MTNAQITGMDSVRENTVEKFIYGDSRKTPVNNSEDNLYIVYLDILHVKDSLNTVSYCILVQFGLYP